MLKKIQALISLHINKQILRFIVILVILAALPITVIVSQKQQEIRQRASEAGLNICQNSCYDAELESLNYPTDTCLAACDRQYSIIQAPTKPPPPPANPPTPTPIPIVLAPTLSCAKENEYCGNRSCCEGLFCDLDDTCSSSPSLPTPTRIPISTPTLRPEISTPSPKPTATPIAQTPTTIVTTPVRVATATCPLHNQGDANCDGKVDILDFNIWLSEFSKELPSQNSDFNRDGQITIDDFYILEFIAPFIKK